MTTYKTGNPIGSANPKDLHDNSQNLDKAVNSQESTWEDRLGVVRPTLKSAVDPTGLVQEAVGAAERAEAAAAAASLAAGVYPDTNTIVNGGDGFDPVPQGHFASVPSEELGGFLDLYKVEAGQAIYIDTYPNATAVKDAIKALPIALTASGRGTWEFYNDDSAFPGYFAIDLNGHVLADLLSQVATTSMFEFHNGDVNDFVQVVVGTNLEIVLGWDTEGNLSVSGLKIPDQEGGPEPELLPYMDDSNLRAVGAEDVFCADLSGLVVSGVFPASGNRVRAIVSVPGLSEKTTVSVSPGSGLLIPDNSKTLHVIIGVGQSLLVGANSEESMISTQALFPESVLMFTSSVYSDIRMGDTTSSGQPAQPLDPGTLVGFEPLVARRAASGPRGETVIETMANTLAFESQAIGAQFKSLSYTAGVGGTAYAGLKKGNQIYENMLIALRKAKVLADEQGWKIVVDAVVCKHGEADSGSTTYKDALLEWRSDISSDVRQITGQFSEVHFILSQPSTFTTATPRAALAMLDLHNENPLFHLACPDYAIGAEDYYTDLLHMKGPGYAQVGSYMARSWKGSLWAVGGKAKVLQMVSATRAGRNVQVLFDVPVKPLQIDTATVQEQEDYGFRFFDSTGQIPISNVTINTDGESVSIELAAEPSGSQERLDYALKPQTNPRTQERMPRGNICDSSVEKSIHNDRPMKNWAVHQQIELNG